MRGCCFFFFNETATTEIYTLSLHDALPILCGVVGVMSDGMSVKGMCMNMGGLIIQVDDRNALL